MNRPILCLGLLAVLTLDGVASGVPWTWVAPKPQGNQMRASAYDAQRDLTVVVGEYGTVMTRTGSGEWQVHQVRTGGRFRCITWTGRFFIAGAKGGGLFRSLDGVNWSRIRVGQFSDGPNAPPSSSGPDYWDLNGDQLISAIATGTNGVTVALAGDSVWVSSDAERRTWKSQELPRPPNDWIYYNDMAYGKGRFAVTGEEGSIVTSTDGLTWTKHTSGTRRDLDFISFNKSFFVAMDSPSIGNGNHDYDDTDAGVVRSEDGMTWTAIEPNWPGEYSPIIPFRPLSAGAKFLIYVGREAYTSTDFTSWAQMALPADSFVSSHPMATGPTSGNRTLVFLSGNDGMISLDRDTIESAEEIAASPLRGTVGGLNNLIVASSGSALVGVTGAFLESGSVWTDKASQQSGFGVDNQGNFVTDSVFQQQGFLVGSQGDYSDRKYFAVLQSNSDGSRKWVIKGSAVALLPGEVAALSAASTEGPVVCLLRSLDGVAPHRLYYSADWDTWEIVASYPVDNNVGRVPMQLDYDSQRFVMLTPQHKLAVSTDGRTWNELPPLPEDSASFRQRFYHRSSKISNSNLPDAFASNGNRLVVTTQKLETSSDGYTWPTASVDGRFFVWDLAIGSPSWREFLAPWASIPDGIYYDYSSLAAGARTLIWGGGKFVKLPQEFSPEREPQAGRCFTSPDGENWTQREMPSVGSHVGWTGSMFVVSTQQGGVLTHPDGLSPEIVSNLRIVSQPSSVEAFNGETVTFEVVVQTDLPGLAYQWFKDDRPIKGAIRSFLNVRSSPSAVGRYHVMLTAAEGAREFSAPAFLSLRSPATWSWQDGLEGDRVITAAPGGRVDLALTEVIGPPGGITYQWFKDGKAIPSQTRASLALSNISLASAGVYTAVITTSAGKVTTEMRRLVVEDGSLLIYTVKGRASVQRSVGGAAGRENLSGYLVVDRSAANPRTALIWIRRDGGQAAYRTEVLANAVMHSTGPGANSTSVLSHAITEGSYPRQNLLLFWLSGTDRLVKIGTTASTFAPSTMSGWVNSVAHSAAGSTIQTVNVALMLDRTLTSTLRLSSLEAAVESLEDTLMERGIYPSSE